MSPDGSKVVYEVTTFEDPTGCDIRVPGCGPSANLDLFMIDADGTDRTPLATTSGVLESDPTWSPDGRELAYVRDADRGQESQIYVIDPENPSAPGRQLTRADAGYGGVYGKPEWSPNGERIAFSTILPDGDKEVVTVSVADGGDMINVSQNPTPSSGAIQGMDFAPTWSPDGTRIGFVSFRAFDGEGTGSDIWIARADGGGELTRVTQDPGWESQPIWSPDGTELVFDSTDMQSPGMYLVDAPAFGGTTLPTPQRITVAELEPHPSDWNGRSPVPADADGDGIADAVDSNPGVVSSAFSDGDGTTGSIVDEAGLDVTVVDLPAPDGVRVTVGAGAGRATLQLCGFTVRLSAGSVVDVTCGSVRLGVIAGVGEVDLGNGTTVSVPQGATGKISANPDGTYEIENLTASGSTAPVVTVTRNGTSTPLPAGDTVVSNTAPSCASVSTTTTSENAIAVTLSCSDPDAGDSLSYSIVTPPTLAQGALGSIGGRAVSFTPDEDFAGTASFRFQASDGMATSNTATATIAVARTCGGLVPTIVGGSGKDTLNGTIHRDVIAGLGGDDRIVGGVGNDVICGGSGNDTIDGGLGIDRLLGGSGNDRLNGGLGRDTLDGGPGADRCEGGLGKDAKLTCES